MRENEPSPPSGRSGLAALVRLLDVADRQRRTDSGGITLIVGHRGLVRMDARRLLVVLRASAPAVVARRLERAGVLTAPLTAAR
jgi:hypothetical protein